MSALSELRTGPARAFALPILLLAAASLVLLVGQAIKTYATTAADGPSDGYALLTPWVVLLAAAGIAAFSPNRLRLALLAGAGAFGLKFAGPLLVHGLAGIGLPVVVWLPSRYRGDTTWIGDIYSGDNALVTISRWVMILGCLLIIAFAITAVVRLRAVLLGPALRSSFSIDVTLLLVIFFVVAYANETGELLGGVGWSDVWGLPTQSMAINVLALSWIIPLLLWLAVTCRQGGVLAIGATAGLVFALGVLPSLMNLVGSLLGGPTASYSQSVERVQEFTLTTYEAFDFVGNLGWAALVSLLLLIVCLWWALSMPARPVPDRPAASAGSPVASLSVVSFAMAWIPVTAVPAIVLGHMAYDGILESQEPRRGLGLARWSIVLAYLTVIGSVIGGISLWGGR